MFRINSRFYIACQWVYRLFTINVLFVITSFPMVTLGASMQAIISSLCLPIDQPYFSTYFKTFKKNIIQTIPFLVFNMFSILFVFLLNDWSTNDFGLSLIIRWTFLVFLLAYNVNLYIANLKIEHSSYIDLFQFSFYITVSSFVKVGIFWMIYSTMIFIFLKNFSVMFLLWGWSVPLFLQITITEKEYRFLSSLKK